MVNDKAKEIGAKAHEYEKKNGCSQAVLAALQEGLDIGDTQSFKAATALAGGAARRGEMWSVNRRTHGSGALRGKRAL